MANSDELQSQIDILNDIYGDDVSIINNHDTLQIKYMHLISDKLTLELIFIINMNTNEISLSVDNPNSNINIPSNMINEICNLLNTKYEQIQKNESDLSHIDCIMTFISDIYDCNDLNILIHSIPLSKQQQKAIIMENAMDYRKNKKPKKKEKNVPQSASKELNEEKKVTKNEEKEVTQYAPNEDNMGTTTVITTKKRMNCTLKRQVNIKAKIWLESKYEALNHNHIQGQIHNIEFNFYENDIFLNQLWLIPCIQKRDQDKKYLVATKNCYLRLCTPFKIVIDKKAQKCDELCYPPDHTQWTQFMQDCHDEIVAPRWSRNYQIKWQFELDDLNKFERISRSQLLLDWGFWNEHSVQDPMIYPYIYIWVYMI